MAKKKDLSSMNTNGIYDAIQEATAAPETEEPKKQEFKLMSVKLKKENADYLRSMAIAAGQTQTEFLNEILDKSRQDNQQLYEESLKFRVKLK